MRISYKSITLAALAVVSLTGCQGGMGSVAKNMWPGNWWTSTKKDPPSIAANQNLQPSQPPPASYGQQPSTLDGRSAGVALAGATGQGQPSQTRVASNNLATQGYGTQGFGAYDPSASGIANPQSGGASQWGAQPSASNPAYGTQWGQAPLGSQPDAAMQQYAGPGAAQYPYPSTPAGQDAWGQDASQQPNYGTQQQYPQYQGAPSGSWDSGAGTQNYNQGAAATQGAGWDHTAASGYSGQDYNSQWNNSSSNVQQASGTQPTASGGYRPGSTGSYSQASDSWGSDPNSGSSSSLAAPPSASGTYR